MAKPGYALCQGCGVNSIRVSWSSLRTHMECKQKGYLTRSGKRAKHADQRNFLAGNVTDRVVRNWLADDERRPGQMKLMVKDQLDASVAEAKTIKWKHRTDKDDVLADCTRAVENMEPDLLKYVTPYQVFPDFKFEAPMHVPDLRGGDPLHVTLNGYMDILVKVDDRRYYIFDVKHTKDNSYWKKTQGQMVFYSLAVKLLYGVDPKGAALLQPLATPRIKPINIAEEARLSLASSINTMANDIVQGVNPPRPDMSLCGWCDVKHACIKFKAEEDGKGNRRVAFGRLS